MHNPLISIIIPTYNASDFLQTAIDSVTANQYSNKELIVVDGNSTDGTFEIIKENDEKISNWISEPDRGIYHAMEKGIGLAKGDWLYFLGADDVLENCLHRLKNFLQDQNVIYYGNAYYKKSNVIYDGEFDLNKIIEKNICQQSIFYPKKIFRHYNFNLKYKILADYDLNLRIWSEGKFIFEYIPILVAKFNDKGLSGSISDEDFHKDKPNILISNFGIKILFNKAINKLKYLISTKS